MYKHNVLTPKITEYIMEALGSSSIPCVCLRCDIGGPIIPQCVEGAGVLGLCNDCFSWWLKSRR